jgi:hypothetical protein
MITLAWLTVILLVACILLMASRLNLASVSRDLRKQEEAKAPGSCALLTAAEIAD